MYMCRVVSWLRDAKHRSDSCPKLYSHSEFKIGGQILGSELESRNGTNKSMGDHQIRPDQVGSAISIWDLLAVFVSVCLVFVAIIAIIAIIKITIHHTIALPIW